MKLQQFDVNKNSIRIGVIGAGKLGGMFLTQATRIHGIHIAGIADLDRADTISNRAYVGWITDKYIAASLDDAINTCKNLFKKTARHIVDKVSQSCSKFLTALKYDLNSGMRLPRSTLAQPRHRFVRSH